jgi:hypothetical protein
MSTVSRAFPYTRGDLRRMLCVLAAIDSTRNATLVRLSEKLGLDRHTIGHLIEDAIEQAGVSIEKEGTAYRIVNWGPVIKKTGAKRALTCALSAQNIE